MALFGKHSTMIVHQEDPFNAGPPLHILCQTYVTPQEHFYVRNHGNVPVIDSSQYRLTVTGMVQQPLELSLEDLYTMPAHTITATLTCAGSRRTELMAVKPIPGELPWGAEAIGNAIWRGVPLQSVLAMAHITETARHVAFTGMDEVRRQGQQFGFGGSVPLEKVEDVLLAYEMNGKPLPPVHGFPLRVVVPGYIGARSVKWLSNIHLQNHPSINYFQAHAYKLFPPHIDAQTVDWNDGQMLGELALNTVICTPLENTICPLGSIVVQGYAVAQQEVPIERVELSVNRGRTWTTATVLQQSHPWSWCFWQTSFDLVPGSYQLIARGWDANGRTQPEAIEQIWNFKGYMNNAWHRVTFTVQEK